MLPLTAMTADRPASSLWTASLYAGLATAVIAIITALLFQAEIPFLYIPAFLLIGLGPVIGYSLATNTFGADWKPMLGGLLGFILLFLGPILWPILVGAFSKEQSIGRLFIGSIVGFILGIVVFLIAASTIGQNPSWIATGFTLLYSVWGGACGAAMSAWATPVITAAE